MSDVRPTIRWKNGPDGIPIQVECDVVGFPNVDADGETQFVNSHFDTEAEAWEKGKSETLAWISLVGSEIERLEGVLAAKREDAGRASVAWKNFKQAYERFQRSREGQK